MHTYFSDNKVTVLEWPGISSDLNPIDNVWAVCNKRIAKQYYTTNTAMIIAVIKILFYDDKIKIYTKNSLNQCQNDVKRLSKTKGDINY